MKKTLRCFIFLSLFFAAVAAVPLTASAQPPRFDYRIVRDDVFFMVGNNTFLVQPVSIVSGGSMVYFAAQDFTGKRNLIVNRTKDIKVITDEKNRKVVRVTFLLGDDEKNNVYNDYELVLFLEIREGMPFLAIYSKSLLSVYGSNNSNLFEVSVFTGVW